MSLVLTAIIIITGMLALYWIFYGQRKYNEMFMHKRKTELKAILFDFDGVIIDSFDSAFAVFNILRARFKLNKFNREDFRKRVWGGTIRESAKKYFENVDFGELMQINMRLIPEHMLKARLMPNAKEVLIQVKNKKIRIGLVTNTPRKPVLKILEYFKIRKFFDAIVAGDDVEKAKPYPDSVLKLCEELGVTPEETILVGDTKNDYRAGKAAGCFVVGLNAHGDLVIKGLNDLLELI